MNRIILPFGLILLCWISSFSQKLRIGVHEQSPPFCFIDERGTLVGVELELAKRIAGRIDNRYPPEFKSIRSPEEREALLTSGAVDFVVAGYSVTKERKEGKTIGFSEPYFFSPTSLAILSYQDNNFFKKGGRSAIGFLRKSTADNYLRNKLDSSDLAQGYTIRVGFKDQKDMIDEFLKRNLDAIVDDIEFLKYLNEHTKEFTVLNSLVGSPPDRYAVAVAAGDAAKYLPKINEVICEMTTTMTDEGLTEFESSLVKSKALAPNKALIDIKHERTREAIIYFLGLPTAATLILVLLGNPFIEKLRRRDKIKVTEEPMNFAWIIANGKYEFRNGLSDYPLSDAKRLQESLIKYGFPQNQVAIQKDATRKGILKTFHDIANRVQNQDVPFCDIIRPKDKLLIYFSGHGDKQQIGPLQIGYWVPVDGAANWDFIPDYEVKTMLGILNVQHVLLISDSCFSGMLLNTESPASIGQDQNIEIITSGNTLVPASSAFLNKLADLLDTHPRDTLSSHEIYNHLRSELTNNRHYLPQYGAIQKGANGADFMFCKPLTPVKEPARGQVSFKMKSILSKFNKARRIISYAELRATCQMDERSFSNVIQRLSESRFIIRRENNSIFITTDGLHYGNKRQTHQEVGL